MTSHRNRGARERRVEPHDSLDDFPTPPWAARAICEHLRLVLGLDLPAMTLWEPAFNRGAFARGAMDYFGDGYFTDIFDYGTGEIDAMVDFTMAPPGRDVDIVATNPPFRLAAEFIERGMQVSRVGCAFLVRNAFAEGAERWRSIYRDNPPTQLLYFSERVVMLKSRLIRDGDFDPVATEFARRKDPDAGDRKASTTRASMVAIWLHNHERLPCAWVPPETRLRLEKEGDYDL